MHANGKRQARADDRDVARAPEPALVGAYLPRTPATDGERALSELAVVGDVLDVEGATRLLQVGRNKLYEMVARNKIPHRRFGRRIRFSRAAIMRWLDSCSLQDAKERQ